jgi:glycosyltransferase involved in cell wall biosynthesis
MTPNPGDATSRPRLSVIVITRNEAHQLRRCLESASFADEWVVVDSGSSDGTPELAHSLGAIVLETTDWPGFGKQKQRALDAATGQWILSLDADEWLDADLARSVAHVIDKDGGRDPATAAFEVTRMSAFCGQWMRASGWFPDRGVRLFRTGAANFSTDLVHEHLVVHGPIERLPGLLMHNSIPNLESAIDKMNRYSSGRAQDLLLRGKHGGLGSAVGHGLWAFFRTFLFRRGFLDGRLGFVLAVHNAETTYYRYLKLWLLSVDQASPRSQARSDPGTSD